MRNRTDTRYLYQSFLSKVWSYILYSPYTLPVSFNKDLTVIYSTLLVWKISQAEKIWWRLYVSFLYYVLLLLLRDCIFQKVNTSEILIIILERLWSFLTWLIQEYPDLCAFILRNKGRIAVRSVHRTHLKGYHLINLIYINSMMLIVIYIRRRNYTRTWNLIKP